METLIVWQTQPNHKNTLQNYKWLYKKQLTVIIYYDNDNEGPRVYFRGIRLVLLARINSRTQDLIIFISRRRLSLLSRSSMLALSSSVSALWTRAAWIFFFSRYRVAAVLFCSFLRWTLSKPFRFLVCPRPPALPFLLLFRVVPVVLLEVSKCKKIFTNNIQPNL